MKLWLHFMWLEIILTHLGSLPYLCIRNETMAPLHVATLTVKRELPKYEIIFSIYDLYLTFVTITPWEIQNTYVSRCTFFLQFLQILMVSMCGTHRILLHVVKTLTTQLCTSAQLIISTLQGKTCLGGDLIDTVERETAILDVVLAKYDSSKNFEDTGIMYSIIDTILFFIAIIIIPWALHVYSAISHKGPSTRWGQSLVHQYWPNYLFPHIHS